MADALADKPATWGQRLPCPCGQRGYLVMMNYDGWFRVECHAGNGCDNFGASDFRKNAVERWNEHVCSGADYRLPQSNCLAKEGDAQ